jgi:hypothetical protein
VDFSKLSTGQKVGVVSGVVLVVNLFLPWYGAFGLNLNAFDAEFFAWGGSFIAIAGGVILALKAFGRADASRGTLGAEQIALLTGGLGFVLIVLRWITENDATRFGLYLGLIAAAGVTYGAYMTMQDLGIAIPDKDDLRSLAGDDDGSPDA